jgi:hypothetical protein
MSEVVKKDEFTVSYWVNKAYEALNEAESIADALGESFQFDGGGYGMGGWYTPDSNEIITKEWALKKLASGDALDDFQKWAIQNAIDNDITEEDSEGWESSSSGWMSSSQSC